MTSDIRFSNSSMDTHFPNSDAILKDIEFAIRCDDEEYSTTRNMVAQFYAYIQGVQQFMDEEEFDYAKDALADLAQSIERGVSEMYDLRDYDNDQPADAGRVQSFLHERLDQSLY